MLQYEFGTFEFITELLFALIACGFCFLMYGKTKESYELTRHKGIGYFRNAFLLFGIAYAFRFVLRLMFFSRRALDIIPPDFGVPFFVFAVGYVSTLALVYLLLSTVWKQVSNKLVLGIGHAVALGLGIASFLRHSHIIVVYVQCLLLFAAVVLSIRVHAKGKKSQKVLYVLVAVMWLISLFILGLRSQFPFWIDVAWMLLSLGVFVAIYVRVAKWIS